MPIIRSLKEERPGLIRKTSLDYPIGIALITSAIAIAIILSIRANTDLAEGRYALFMDERITFDGVRTLLHPKSIRSLIDSVIDGGDHRYGRILWNASAFFSLLPERAWGIGGQIVSTRLTYSIIQLAAYWIFIFSFIKNWTLRGVGLLLLVALPYSAYFATMPKPEPIQALFLAFFLAIAAKKSFQFGYYWLFLGLAFGAKVSTVTLVPLFFGLGLIGQKYQQDWVGISVPKRLSIETRLPTQIICTFLGSYQIFAAVYAFAKTNEDPFIEKLTIKISEIIIWQPISEASVSLMFFICRIFLAMTLIFAPTLIRYLASNKHYKIVKIIKSIGMLVLGFCVSVPVVFFKFPRGVLTWLSSTFLNTSHGSDDASINIQSWMQYILNDYLPIPAYWTILFLLANILCFVSVALLLRAEACNIGGIHNRLRCVTDKSHSLVLLACSVLSIFPIILSVNRLWGHYLHLGTIFFVVAMLTCYEELASYEFSKPGLRRLIRFLLALLITTQVLLIFTNMIPSMALDMNRYANRTATKEYEKKKEEYTYISSLISQRSAGKNMPIKAHIGADIFIPEGDEQIQIAEIFGFFSQWDANADLIVFYRSKSPLSKKPSITSAMYDPWLAAHKAFVEHLSTDDKVCLLKPCYTEMSTPYPELVVLSRID